MGAGEDLLLVLDRAGARHHRQRPIADRRVEDPDHSVLRMELAGGELERPIDRRDPLDPGQHGEALEKRRLAAAHLADHGDDHVVDVPVVERRQTLCQDPALDPQHLGFAGPGGHHDEHRAVDSSLIEVGQTKKQRSRLCFVRPARPVPSVSVTDDAHAGHRK